MSEKPPKSPKPVLINVKPRTLNQNRIFREFDRGKHLYIHGTAGTGKSFLSVYLALNEIVNKNTYREVVVVRSAVPSRSQGFLPGSLQEKDEIYELPYEAIVNDLFTGTQNHYKYLKNMGHFRFLSTSYLRGITIDNAIIIVDEVQNYTGQEIDTVITRIGKDCRMIILGDSKQNDLVNMRQDSCIDDLHKIISRMNEFSMVEMTVDDIQRNDLVKSWILARDSVSNALPRFITR